MEKKTLKVNTSNIHLEDWSRSYLFEAIQLELLALVKLDAPFIKSHWVQDESISRSSYSEYFFDLFLEHLDIEQFIKFYNQYLTEIIDNYLKSTSKDVYKIQQYFVRITTPKIAKSLIAWVKRDSKFYQKNNDREMFDTFTDSIIKLNSELFSERRDIKSNDVFDGPTTISVFLEDIFNEYMAVIFLFSGEIEKSKIIIDELGKKAKRGEKFSSGSKALPENLRDYRAIFEVNERRKKESGKDNLSEASDIVSRQLGYDKERERTKLYKRFHKFKKKNHLHNLKDFDFLMKSYKK
jgi:hypothetical protein